MTNDEAVEVMAMAFAASSPCEMTQAEAIAATRAAIRAHHAAGGLVLREVPGPKPADAVANGDYWRGFYAGHNAALAAVCALAVEVV